MPAQATTSSIICGVDQASDAHATARVAATLAERLRLRLILVHALPAGARPLVATRRGGDTRDAMEAELADLFGELRDNASTGEADIRIEDGGPPERLACVAEAEDAAFIVVGTRGQGFPQAAVRGSVSIATVRVAPCPVIVVPPIVAHEQREPLAAGRILCGVAGPEDRRVVHGAARVAGMLGLPLTIAHVMAPQDRDVPGPTVSAVPLTGTQPADAALAEAHTRLAPLLPAARSIASKVDGPRCGRASRRSSSRPWPTSCLRRSWSWVRAGAARSGQPSWDRCRDRSRARRPSRCSSTRSGPPRRRDARPAPRRGPQRPRSRGRTAP